MDIMKLANIASVTEIAKCIVNGSTTGVSKSVFDGIVLGHARLNKRRGESDADAFERVLQDPNNTELRKAYRICQSEAAPLDIGNDLKAVTKKQKEDLVTIAKRDGVMELVSLIKRDNNSHGFTQFELVELAKDEAVKIYKGKGGGYRARDSHGLIREDAWYDGSNRWGRVAKTREQAFAKWMEDPNYYYEHRALMNAIEICPPGIEQSVDRSKRAAPLMDTIPTSVEVGSTDVVSDAWKAAAQLAALVEEQRARAPTLTTSELYRRVYADPANRSITGRAHPSTSSISYDAELNQ
jgi:hypothetical protein